MKRTTFTILAAAMASAAAVSGAAFADSKDASEIALFQKARHDATAAVSAAEAASGGKAVSAEFGEKGSAAGQWEVKTVVGSQRIETRIDAATGEVIKGGETDDTADKSDVVTPQMIGGTLPELIAKAEAAGGGKVMSIGADHEDGKFRGMEVELATADGSLHDFLLNPADGKMTPVVEGHDGDHEEGDDEQSDHAEG